MKNTASIVLLSMCVLLFACDKTKGIQAEVIKDCTGTYLRVDHKDYWVCNYKKMESFAPGTMVLVAFEKSTNCNSDFPSCYMLHENEGGVEVNQIKKL